jgi:SAM-dependent methyltransferase
LDWYPEAEHVGADISGRSVLQLPIARRMVADGQQMPFADTTFDLVIGVHTFHHFARPLVGMRECLRVGSALAFIEPMQSPMVSLLASVGVIAREEFGERIHRFTPADLRAELTGCERSFKIETYLYKSHPAFHTVLRRVHQPAITTAIQNCYRIANLSLRPLHTKLCAVVVRDNAG